MAEVGSYKFWGPDFPGTCDMPVEEQFKPAIRSLFPPDPREIALPARPDCVLVPEPEGPRGPESISVRVGERTIGYLPVEQAQAWAGPVRRVIASGLLPVAGSRIWVNEWGRGNEAQLSAHVRLNLGDPVEALPFNDPPTDPYTMVPRSSAVKATKPDEYLADLLPLVPPSGRGMLFATLHERPPAGSRGRPIVEVCVDGRRVGELTSQTSQRYLAMIEHFGNRGLVCACYARITGSPVAAEIQIFAVKANEASDEFLYGEPVVLPQLTPHLNDPLAYDLTPLAEHLRTRPLPEGLLPTVVSETTADPQDVGEGPMANGSKSPAGHEVEFDDLWVPDGGQVQTVRNLVLLLAGDVGVLATELKSTFDGFTAEHLPPRKVTAVESELAGIAIKVFRLADELGVDLTKVIRTKLHPD